jgi:signal transduction histidine kinase
MDEVRDGLVNMIDTIHRIARALRPAALDEVGVVAAIEEHVRLSPEAADLSVEVEADAIDGLLSPEAELALYRIVQEALANAVRHGNPRNVRVHVERRTDVVHTVVSDDGRGFAVAEKMSGTERGLGLLGMHERAAYLGGRVHVTSQPGDGTEVRVEIPRADSV